METYEQEFDVKFMSVLIKCIAFIFRWICLINCILCAGFTIGLLVMYMVKGNSISISILSSMVEAITPLTTTEVIDLVEVFGIPKMMVAATAYGFAHIVFYGLLHSLITKFTHVFNTILDGNMFTKENVEIIDGAVLQSIIIAFVRPLMIYAIYSSTRIFSLTDMDTSAIVYILVVYVAKLVFTKGYDLSESNNSKLKEISDIKARENEEKIAVIRELSEKTEKTQKAPKKGTKKVTKKTTSK